MHEHLWLSLADLGVAAVIKNSFLLHYVNSTIEQLIETHFWLLRAINVAEIAATDLESAREGSLRARFQEKLGEFISWETAGIYSRIIPAMFEHGNLNYLDDAIKGQCRFAYWGIDFGLLNVASDALRRVSKACDQLLVERATPNPYEAARKAIHIAEIGIYALTSNATEIVEMAVAKYKETRVRFSELHPDLSFAGDFDSHERDLIEQRRFTILEPVYSQFYSRVRRQDKRGFFEALES